MPRSTCVIKKRNKRSRARNCYLHRQEVLKSIENSEQHVAEDAHLAYFANLPEEILPDLCVEVDRAARCSSPSALLSGNRIVDIGYFIEQVRKLAIHDMSCTTGKMIFCKESRNGLVSHLTYKCSVCGRNNELKTQNCDNDLNRAFVWGVSSVGAGYAQAEELFAIMNVPIMTKKTYKRVERVTHSRWEEMLCQQMYENAMKEKQLAIEEGRVEEGIPYITVIVDGGWAKRSYGHGYSSLSGVACIIGQKTKKLLYIGVKNKFCYVCATTKNEHKCYKNYIGPSTGMEQTIIVEGFNKSESDYGMRYKYVIGDGDSSVYTRILENVTYGRNVFKLECANHATRAFTSNLYRLIKNTHFDITARNIVKSKIPSFSLLIRTIIARTPEINHLKIDLKNSLRHIFGDHQYCRKEVCRKENVIAENNVILLESANIFGELIKICDSVIRKADRLCDNVTTNYAERYMSTVAKFTGGKRTNLIQRGVYRTRCIGAGLSYNSGPTFHKLSTKLDKKFLNKFCARRQKVKSYKKKSKKKIKITSQQQDMDYGMHAAESDLLAVDFEASKNKIMTDLNNSDITEIERRTVGQRENIHWFQARRNRLTASSFGKICSRRQSTPSHNLVKELFYRNPDLKSKAIQYGIENEKLAIDKFQIMSNTTVTECGLFVCKDYPFLGASPDGLIEVDSGLVEVKCLYSMRNKIIREAIKDNKKMCIELYSDDSLHLKANHHHYFQIQGQLNISQRNYCYLILYTDIDIEFIKVERNEGFWKDNILPKLIKFWENCALPELADPRIPRGLKSRDNAP